MGQPKNKRTAGAPAGLAVVEQLLALMGEHELAELAFEQGDLKIALKKAGEPVAVVPAHHAVVAAPHAPAAAAAPPVEPPATDQESFHEIISPMVGTFYAAPDPESGPFIEVGSRVTPDTVVCVVEAMKVMNEIKAECGGTVRKVLVTNGQAVEYGQPLFAVEPD